MWSPDVLLGLEVQNFKKQLHEIAAKDTSSDPDNWHEANPTWGHCAVAALLVQDLFGGTLLNAKVNGVSHYWNKLESGTEVDVTFEQFLNEEPYVGPLPLVTAETDGKQRDYVLSFPETKRRYELLKQRYSAGE